MRPIGWILLAGVCTPAAWAQDGADSGRPMPANVRRISDVGTGVAAWDDGTCWIGRPGGRLVRLDATTGKVLARVQLNGDPIHVAVGKTHVYVTAQVATQLGSRPPKWAVHEVTRGPTPALVRTQPVTNHPLGTVPLAGNRLAVVGRPVVVFDLATGKVATELLTGEGEVVRWHHAGRWLALLRQYREGNEFLGGLTVVDLTAQGEPKQAKTPSWPTDVRVVGDRVFATGRRIVSKADGRGVYPWFGAADCAAPVFTERDKPALALLPDLQVDGEARYGVRIRRGLAHVVAVDDACRPIDDRPTVPLAGVTTQEATLLHADAKRFVVATRRQGVYIVTR